MSGRAAVRGQPALDLFPQYAAAGRARHFGAHARGLPPLRYLRARGRMPRGLATGRRGRRSAHECIEHRTDLRRRQHVVDRHILDRAARHLREGRRAGVLGDRHATAVLDLKQPSRAVIEHARQHDADRARPVDTRGAAKQGVHRRAYSVLGGALVQTHVTVLDDHVGAARRYVHHPRLQTLAVAGVARHQCAHPREDLGQHAGSARADVQHDQCRRREIARQRGDELGQRLDPSGGCAHECGTRTARERIGCLRVHSAGVRLRRLSCCAASSVLRSVPLRMRSTSARSRMVARASSWRSRICARRSRWSSRRWPIG